MLQQKIREEGTIGTCPWCGSMTVKVVGLGELTELFTDLMQLYVASDRGESPEVLIENDWQVFSERLLAQPGFPARDLLLAILEYGLQQGEDVDERDYRSLFERRDSSALDLHGDWDDRVEQLLQNASATPNSAEDGESDVGAEPEYDAVVDAVESVGLAYRTNREHFRARIHKNRSRRTRLAPEEMGAPQPQDATAGRANRAGEPVLYLASDEKTALAEVRAWKGALVAVAPMRLSKPRLVLNLVNVPAIRSPLGAGDLTWFLEARGLLRRFGAELSRPVIPGEEARHYLPSQHICDVAKRAGFGGVAYPSAMGPGHNLILFDVGAAHAEHVTYYRVKGTDFRMEVYAPAEVIIDDWPHE